MTTTIHHVTIEGEQHSASIAMLYIHEPNHYVIILQHSDRPNQIKPLYETSDKQEANNIYNIIRNAYIDATAL